MRHIPAYILLILICATSAVGSETRSVDWTVLEGQLSQVSKLPPAKDNSYPDCYYTAVVDVAQIISGQSIARKVVLVLPGFLARQYAPEANYKVGDKVRTTVVPFNSMPDKVRQTQQADEIEDVDLEFYFPENIALVSEFHNVATPVPFADNIQKVEVSASSQPIDLKARAARQEQMQHDLQQINKLLAKHGGDWDKWYESLKDSRAQYKKQYDAKAQRWVGNSFFSAGYIDNSRIYSHDFIKSAIAFKNYLAARDVDLILVRVPNKGEIVDDLFTSAQPDQISNPYLLRMYKELLEADVEIITSIIPRAKQERLKFPLMYWYQNFTEDHPAEGISWVIAEEFADRISRYSRVQSMPKKTFTIKPSSIDSPKQWLGFPWPAGNPKFKSSEQPSFAAVMDDKSKPLALTQGMGSPVLLLGSSYIVVPASYKGASIPQYFSYLTGVAPDLVNRMDADFMMPRSIARLGDAFLKNRSVCLFPFVPGVAYRSLALPPIFDPDNSTKSLIASHSGPTMSNAIEYYPNTPDGTFSYSPEGVFKISPINKDPNATVSIRIKVPDAVSDFPYFILEVEFGNEDQININARYSGQSDSIKRSFPEYKNEATFAFATKSGKWIDIDFSRIDWIKTSSNIKSFNFYGVKQPTYYKTKNGATDN